MEYDFEIDPSTGLPRLEEGYFWEAIKQPYDSALIHKEFSNLGKYGFSTKLLRPLSKPVSRSGPLLLLCKTESVEVSSFFGLSKSVVEKTRLVMASPILYPATVFNEFGSVYKYERSPSIMSWTNVTPESILHTAKYIFTNLYSKQKSRAEKEARAEKASKLFGTYPPKSL